MMQPISTIEHVALEHAAERRREADVQRAIRLAHGRDERPRTWHRLGFLVTRSGWLAGHRQIRSAAKGGDAGVAADGGDPRCCLAARGAA